MEVVLMQFNDEDGTFKMVAGGKIEHEDDLLYETCLVKFDWNANDVMCDSDYIFPCNQTMFVI